MSLESRLDVLEKDVTTIKERNHRQDYVLSALSSTAGLIISSQTLPFIKKWWLRNQGK